MVQQKKVLIVEDEGIVALSIRETLKKLGYVVTGICATGEDAIQKTGETLPDVVLMDIHLKGDMDGISATEKISGLYDIPVIYLTAYTDDETLNRAMKTRPHSYLVKPFNERELYSNIEFAIYKHRIKQKTDSDIETFEYALRTIPDAAIIVDLKGNVDYINPAAEILTGWKNEEMKRKNFFHESDFRSTRHRTYFDKITVKNIIERGSLDYLHDIISITTKSGTRKNLSLTTGLVHDDEGTVKRIIYFLKNYQPDIVATTTKTGGTEPGCPDLLNALPYPALVMDRDLNILHCNSLFLDLAAGMGITQNMLKKPHSGREIPFIGTYYEYEEVFRTGNSDISIKILPGPVRKETIEVHKYPVHYGENVMSVLITIRPVENNQDNRVKVFFENLSNITEKFEETSDKLKRINEPLSRISAAASSLAGDDLSGIAPDVRQISDALKDVCGDLLIYQQVLDSMQSLAEKSKK
jgi:PAS domain S-box-containing protein